MAPAPSITKAALWMALSIASFLAMSVAGRTATAALNVFQVLELRSVIGFFILLPLVLMGGGFRAMRTQRPLAHIARNVVHYAGQAAWLYALTLIPLAVLISIEFTTPIWTAILAVTFLGERLPRARLTAIVLGLIGVVIIVRPGVGSVDPGHLVVLGAAMCFGVSVVMVKSLTRTDSVVRIIFWMLIIQSVVGLVPALYVWRNPAVELWPSILVVAFTGMSSHFCMARALSHAGCDRHFADGLPARAAVCADRMAALQRADRCLHRRGRLADPDRQSAQPAAQGASACRSRDLLAARSDARLGCLRTGVGGTVITRLIAQS